MGHHGENIENFHSAIILWIQREIQILTHLKQPKKQDTCVKMR